MFLQSNYQLELKLNVLFEQFKQIVNESLINTQLMINPSDSTTTYMFGTNSNLEVIFQVFIINLLFFNKFTTSLFRFPFLKFNSLN